MEDVGEVGGGVLVRQHAEQRFVRLRVVGQADVVVDYLLWQPAAPSPLSANLDY